jgi:hypothetical protein
VTSWSEFAAAAPEFAQRELEHFTARQHSTLATLRLNGSPRISGTEGASSRGVVFRHDAEIIEALDL